jgi:hypothetical protein
MRTAGYKWMPLAVMAAITLLGGCAQHVEAARVPCSDGRVDAVLVESHRGSGSAYWYDVYVLPTGAPYDSGQTAVTLRGAVRNERLRGANLKWLQPDLLTVEFESAQSIEQALVSVHVGGRDVRVMLNPGITDPGAPAAP